MTPGNELAIEKEEATGRATIAPERARCGARRLVPRGRPSGTGVRGRFSPNISRVD